MPLDPLNLLHLTNWAPYADLNCTRTHCLSGPLRQPKTTPSDDEDPFSKLPNEILCEIFMHLNSSDARALKISSPSCDSIELSNQFWRSRFWPGRDYPYYYDADTKVLSPEKWQMLWFVVRELDSSHYMSERKRLYMVSDKLRQLVTQRIRAPVCCGTPVGSKFEPECEKPGHEWLRASAWFCKPKDCFHRGARALWKRDAPVPASFTSIHISWLIINGQKYISGIRIDQDGAPATKLGYLRPGQETMISWEGCNDHSGNDGVVGFDLAIDHSGIRGLAVISPSRGISKWVGDTWNISKGSLIDTPPIKNLRAKFDALKMVSLAINLDVVDVASPPK
ncbi:hypothetical protein FSARC_6711 [Fusarium sarcochroum]|uniref:F-box domain-containing protein n=1 Tax=Fusarium sarcochroum TaxID=1208366 RepID=A0A8H4X833_9HYPO|nr:hypothetical protein FSARC_6711 [Fusarium sarcochroum]